jgi:hypothetical protein
MPVPSGDAAPNAISNTTGSRSIQTLDPPPFASTNVRSDSSVARHGNGTKTFPGLNAFLAERCKLAKHYTVAELIFRNESQRQLNSQLFAEKWTQTLKNGTGRALGHFSKNSDARMPYAEFQHGRRLQ